MLAIECPCGEHIEGSNDSQILKAMKEHATDDHEGEYSEADLRLLVSTAADVATV